MSNPQESAAPLVKPSKPNASDAPVPQVRRQSDHLDPQDPNKLEKKTSSERLIGESPRLSKSGSLRLMPGKNIIGSSSLLQSGTLVKELGSEPDKAAEVLWNLMSSYLSREPKDIQQYIVNHLEYTLARSRFNSDKFAAYQATAYSVRDRLIEFWNDTNQTFHECDPKRVYYMSIEFLMGRALQNAVVNLDITGPYAMALKTLGYKLEEVIHEEQDAALGNGGLGRLAACFLDSLATLDYPAWGYGIRYNYGMFKQEIVDGFQQELPDYWLARGNPWEIERHDIAYKVRFGGSVRCVTDPVGHMKFVWHGGDEVLAVAYDMPIPGYKTATTINLRLWSSRPSTTFNLDQFNRGDYYKAIEQKQAAENITSVLYPNDNTEAGKELRLKQQYFFAAATLADIFRRFKIRPRSMLDLPTKVAIQLNDTHPTIAVAELMRKLLDEENLSWDQSWTITTQVFAYTNHTVLPEALERWPLPVFERLFPRHIQIIYEINSRFLAELDRRHPGDSQLKAHLSIIEEGTPKRIRMAHLAIVASHSVNGVAEIHTEIIKNSTFREFYRLFPERFNNKTNGVTPRRWIADANPGLSLLITQTLGNDNWLHDLDLCKGLLSHADDYGFQQRFMAIKRRNKERLRQEILLLTNGRLDLDTNALFDVQIKRIHEYKRQLLNLLGIVHRYLQIKAMTPEQRANAVPRFNLFGGKAAPGYAAAKCIIKMINAVADVVNNDPTIGNLLKVYFIPNYNVSLAEVIIPATDLSEHISTAGTEASGTSNMKFAMNGSLIIGTLDGANIEIMQEIKPENIFIFGLKAAEVEPARSLGPRSIDESLYRVLLAFESGRFGDYALFDSVLKPMWSGNDYYLLAHDFRSYINCQARVDEVFRAKDQWAKMCIASTAGSGKFSSDRTIKEYAEQIWGVKPCRTPAPSVSAGINAMARPPFGTSPDVASARHPSHEL